MCGLVVLFLVTVVRCSVLFVMLLNTCVVVLCTLSRNNTTNIPQWSGVENVINNQITNKQTIDK
jgi:hypothetical protein